MLNKKTIFILIFLFSSLYAHNIPGIEVEANIEENNKVQIRAFFKRSKKSLVGNEVRLISMIDNRVLKKGFLGLRGISLDIPNESYWIYVIVRDNDIVIDGIAPKEGFSKIAKREKVAFLYTTLASSFFIILSFIIGYKRTKRFKQTLI